MIDDDDTDPDFDEAVSPESPVEDSVSPKGYRGKQRELSIREDERKQFWNTVLSSDVGRREIWGLLRDSHFDEDRFAAGPSGVPDPLASWLHRGEQAFGYRLFLTFMRYARTGTLQMLEEHDVRLQAFDQKPPPRRRRA